MAAPIAVGAIEKLVAFTSQQLANEASLVLNFREDLRWMTRKLNLIKDYVKNAHHKSTENDAVKQWLRELHDFAFDAEDIMDECAAESLSCALSCSGLIFKHKTGRKIRDLKARMNSIVEDANQLQLFSHLAPTAPTEEASTSSSRAEQWKRSSLLESNARPVAIEAKVDEILRLLDDVAHDVIGVVGMGGVGKTFLLQNVYNDPRTKRMFEKCIWLSISQTYSLKKLQSDMAFSLDLRDVVAGHLTKEKAAEVIHDSLNGKKILIVLDDVWRVTQQDNLIERLGIPIANTQCKIVVTTRSKEVCQRVNASSIYYMEVLEDEDSWDLFCVYAFYPDNKPPQHLKEIAGRVERECRRLPLALKTVAASMAKQERRDQWEVMLQKLKAVRKPDPIMEILQLSYDFLPPDIKPCFLYFAFFGEDERIDVEYLINLWRAEGFLPEGDDWRETGLDWYYQLCNLCLVEAGESQSLYKYCNMHDLLRDLAISICRENKCGFSLEEGCTRYSSSCTLSLSQPDKSSGCRRMFMAKQGIEDDQIADRRLLFPTFLRTLSLGNNPIENIPARLFSKVRALRVLDLRNTEISSLPSSIGRLKLLRVLNLENTHITEVPPCVRSLKNLCMLKISGSRSVSSKDQWVDERVEEWKCLLKCFCRLKMYEPEGIVWVPDWIGELKCLEHLDIRARYMPKTISKLHSLRILLLLDTNLSVKGNGLLRLEDVGNLIGLQELYIEIHCEAELQKMEGLLERLVNMRKLTMWNEVPTAENSDDDPAFPENLTPMKNLEYLCLRRFVVASWICEFVNLKVLQLLQCHCSEYPAVESLPNLITLDLFGNRKCREVRKSFGKCGAFPKLRFLTIYIFPMLEEFPVLEGGSMPCLEELWLKECKRVRRVEGLEQLKSLKEFNFMGSGTAECRETLKEAGEERKKIKVNNPRVHILVSD